VEGSGSYGAGLTRLLLDRGVNVVEVDRPDRRTRRQHGKSDPIDAEAAARAVLAGVATAPAKRRDGIVEAIRALRAARSAAIKARTAAINQLKGLLVTAPASVREGLDALPRTTLVVTCARPMPTRCAGAGPSTPSTSPPPLTSWPPTTPCSPSTPACATSGRRG